MERKCEVCGTVLDGRADAKTCSDKCKKSLQRIRGTGVVPDTGLSGTPVPDVVPDKLSVTGVCPGCLERDVYIEGLEQKIRDWDVRTMILRGHLASAETRAVLAEKELAGYKKGGQGKPQSIYKLGGV